MARRRSFALAYSQGTTPIQPDIMIFTALLCDPTDDVQYWPLSGVNDGFNYGTVLPGSRGGSIIPIAGTFRNLYVQIDIANPSADFFVRVSRAFPLSPLLAVVANGDSNGTNTTDSFHVAAGDAIAIITPTGLATSGITNIAISFEFVPD